MKKKDIEDVYRLSPVQEGMLFHALEAPGSGVYIQQFMRPLVSFGRSVDRLQRAWEILVDHHSVLRSAFLWRNMKRPVQVVSRQAPIAIDLYDLQGLSHADEQQAIEEFLVADRKRDFDLDKPPLQRLALLKTSTEQYFVWTFHHLLLDGWSSYLILEDLSICLEAIGEGRESILAPSPSFKGYITWLQRQDMTPIESYWRKNLAGITPTNIVQHRHGKSVADIESYKEMHVEYPPQRVKEFEGFLRRQRLTLNTLLHGAWAKLLATYSGEKDVTFGSVVSGRSAELPEAESMVGMFINTLPVRVRLQSDETVNEWLKRLQDELAEMRQYEHSPLVNIQQWSGLARNTRLFESIIAVETFPVSPSIEKTFGRMRDNQSFMRTNYPITLTIEPGDRLSLKINWETEYFDTEFIARLLKNFQQLLETMVAEPEQLVRDLSLLTVTERDLVLNQWNETDRSYPSERSIQQCFEAQVEKTPLATVVVFDELSMTYEELNLKANVLAHRLRAFGVGPEVLVGICVTRSLDMVVGLLAILKAGGGYVPLDPEYPKSRLALLLADTQAPVLLTQSELMDVLPQCDVQVVYLDQRLEPDEGELHNPANINTADDLSYVIYTSGSTGQPKGVQISHRAVNRTVFNNGYHEFTPKDKVGQAASISFDAATVEIWGPLLTGGALHIISKDTLLSPALLENQIRQQGITFLFLTVALFNRLAEGAVEVFACLQDVLFGGEICNVALVTKVFKEAPPKRLLHVYGPTESTTFATWYQIKAVPRGRTVPIGRPLGNTRLYVLDTELNPVPIGVAGELYIAGDGLARGYLNQPELSEECFILDPFSSALGKAKENARMYRTGDLVRYLPDGNLDFIDRIDRQVKIRGFRIELEEIEAVLVCHPQLREVVVLVREDTPGNKLLVAYFVPMNMLTAPTVETLRNFLQEQLPEYLIPNSFVLLPQLPLTTNGKVNREALPAPQSFARSNNAYIGPRDAIEHKLVSIWESLLATQDVSVCDHFDELGGHSLVAMQLVARIEQSFSVYLPLTAVLQAPTIEQMAVLIRRNCDPVDTPLVLLNGDNAKVSEPLYLVHASSGTVFSYLKLAQIVGEDRPVYGIQAPQWGREEKQFDSIRALAAHYVTALQKVQPSGPYHLAGWSLGGWIAYEMAQQLRAQNNNVASLILIDSYVPRLVPRHEFDDIDVLLEIFGYPIGLQRSDLPEGTIQMQTDYLLECARQAGVLSPDFDAVERKHLTTAFKANRTMGLNYQPEPYAGAMTLLQAQQGIPDFDHQTEPALGWRALALAGIEVYQVPGNHHNMVTPPYVDDLALTVRQYLHKVQQDLNHSTNKKLSHESSTEVTV